MTMLRPRARFAENIAHFVRLLRHAGLPVGPERTIAALEAVQAVGLERRDDLRSALSAVLVSRQEHQPIFDQAFTMFWRNPRTMEQAMAELLPKVHGRASSDRDLPSRLATPPREHPSGARPYGNEEERQFDATFTFSQREVLRHRDFETMTSSELDGVRTMLQRLRLPLPERAIRRTRLATHGSHVDLRATMRRAIRMGGAMIPLARREHRRRTPSLIVLCDISGSMERYARMLMHFLHAITNDHDRVHVFLFGTRLTNVTRQLRHHDVDVALARVGTSAPDWAGGTRIGACLSEFNRRWSRRVLAQDAIVLLITDGLDTDSAEGVGAAMDRLGKSCRRVMWLNPLLRYDGFEPRAAGIRAMLPFVDDFLPVHNLDSLIQLAAAFERPARARPFRRRHS